MFKMLVRIVLAVLLIFGIFWFIGTNVKEFSKDIELKNPLEVFNINLPKLEETETTIELGESENKENNNQETINEQQESNNSNKAENTSTNNDSQESTEQQKEENTNITSTSAENNKEDNTKEQKTGITKEELEKLVSNIRVSSGKNIEEYDRDTFEKPTQKYTYNGQKLTRNKYAWHVSKHLVNEDPFEYNCPYTGLVINDMSTLDFDHIVSLKVVHENCPDWWTEKEMNEYAYDMLVGVDVLNSSNRSKSAKTPTSWLPDSNIEDFCFTYLAICYKYDIAMDKNSLEVCKLEILNAISAGEEITFINQFKDGTKEYEEQLTWYSEIKNL